eukprot:CAMPEP_0185747216 /NCGR_PEP_ID=MMETSP1174-20130828/5829_1 /TAXON_ID=35687 /ORGANISM="Dictyocha speculum, Strain CCMP1381" /LENGTH=161 /DNA_ID=CAMNT_0028422283 /DNA_START=94 /DNA_END=579 /DNA_ORIENTATION=+
MNNPETGNAPNRIHPSTKRAITDGLFGLVEQPPGSSISDGVVKALKAVPVEFKDEVIESLLSYLDSIGIERDSDISNLTRITRGNQRETVKTIRDRLKHPEQCARRLASNIGHQLMQAAIAMIERQNIPVEPPSHPILGTDPQPDSSSNEPSNSGPTFVNL